jgi:hypothetical protein
MAISAHEGKRMLLAQGGNPKIIRWNGLALAL